MAKTVASLAVSVVARTAGLRKGLQGASRQVSQFGAKVSGVAGMLAKLGAGLVTGIGGGAVTGTGLAINSLNNLAKTADKLKIAPNALIALRDAAQQSGVEVKTFDTGLQRMLRRIQEASTGKGEALGVLGDLGLDAKALIKLAPEKQFEAIAKAMKAGADDGMDLSRAMKLFDSDGVALVNTLKLLNDTGLDKFIDDVKKSGRAVTRDQLKPIESIEDRFSRLGDRIVGVFTQMALAVAGPLDKNLKRLEDFLASPDAVKAMAEAFKTMGEGIKTASKAIDDFLKNYDSMKKEAKAVGGSVLDDGKTILKAVGTLIGGQAAAAMQPDMAGFSRLHLQSLEDASAILDDLPDRIKKRLGEAKDAVVGKATEIFEAIPGQLERAGQSVRDTLNGKSGGQGGKVFKIQRSDGTPVNLNDTSLGGMQSKEVIDELRKQTQILDRGTDPRSLPKGTMVLIAG